MDNRPLATPRRFIALFIVSLVGAVAGILAAPRIVAAFDGTPAWLLPLLLCGSVALALLAAWLVFRILGQRR